MARADKYERRHIADMAAYERMIEEIYRQAAREAAYIAQTVPDFNPDALFSFKDYPITRQRVNELLEKLHSGVETTVVNGIKAEWTLANNKNSELSRRVFGDSIGKLTQAQYRRYFSTNGGALDAFLKRKEAGLNLSDRVWNYTNGFKGEIELGIDIGLRNGLSADEMSRELRSYLKHPDMLFRRVRDEHGQLVLSKRAAAFHPGQGVYRSSYMNARRLAATETNMAYRTADHLRHQQLDFVVGIEIRLSNNHNCKGVPAGQFFDICDELQGRYPKDFKFTGWHPHCRCHVETILKTEKELMAENEAILKGEEPSQDSVNRVYAMPKAFTDWLANNEERIERARSLPYFLRDNGSMKDGVYRLNKFGASSVQSAVDGVFRRATLEELKEAGITIYGEGNFAGSFGEEADFDYIGVKAGLESIAGSNGFKIDRFVVKSRDDYFGFVAEGKWFSLARGFIRRPNGEIECHHTYFELAEELQGKGISKDVFRTFYPEYKRMGVDYLTVYANINVGGYTWSKYGFYAEDMSNALHAARRSSEAQSIVHEFYAKLQDKNTPFPMHLIADLPDGKEILKGTSWYGILDFRNPEQVSIFERYLGIRKNKLGAGTAKLGRNANKEAFESYSREGAVKKNKYSSEQVANHAEVEKILEVKRGNDMTFKEADAGHGNADYRKGIQFSENCQCCVVANELRRRGFNVTALGYDGTAGSATELLANDLTLAFKNRRGTRPQMTNVKEIGLDAIEKATAQEGRYIIGFDISDTEGHVVCAERLHSGELVFFDPQSGDAINLDFNLIKSMQLLRIDNLLFDTGIIGSIVRAL